MNVKIVINARWYDKKDAQLFFELLIFFFGQNNKKNLLETWYYLKQIAPLFLGKNK